MGCDLYNGETETFPGKAEAKLVRPKAGAKVGVGTTIGGGATDVSSNLAGSKEPL